MSSLEQKVSDWLSRNGVAYSTQTPMFGGSTELGGATVDFVIPERRLALRCMGSYWHSGFEAKARDLLGKERLIQQGYQVVDLWEEDLTETRIENTMQLALLGQGTLK